MNIEFVSYTGKWPTLCSGVLTLLIEGKEVRFGHESNSYDWKTNKYRDNNYEDFWQSGGSCYFDSNGDSNIVTNSWEINDSDLPDIYINLMLKNLLKYLMQMYLTDVVEDAYRWIKQPQG